MPAKTRKFPIRAKDKTPKKVFVAFAKVPVITNKGIKPIQENIKPLILPKIKPIVKQKVNIKKKEPIVLSKELVRFKLKQNILDTKTGKPIISRKWTKFIKEKSKPSTKKRKTLY